MADLILYTDHQPSLQEGDYKITATPSFSLDSKQQYASTNPIPILEFTVAAEKDSLNLQSVHSVFPPAGGFGSYDEVLPHIVLQRSTLPWEVEIVSGNPSIPWLALLLIPENDNSYTITTKSNGDVPYTEISVNSYSDFESKFPASFDQVSQLTHVRGEGGSELAVIIGKRHPLAGVKNTVHLVSLENVKKFPLSSNPVTFKSIYSWSFFCNEHFRISAEVLEEYLVELNSIDPAVKLGDVLLPFADQEFFSWEELKKTVLDPLISKFPGVNYGNPALKDKIIEHFEISHLYSILKHLNKKPTTLFYETTDQETHEKSGFIKLDYSNTAGVVKQSLYRGPLVPVSKDTTEIFHSVRDADQLFRKIQTKSGKFLPDISYSSAWELGRLLCLQNKNFSVQLYKWKMACYQMLKINGIKKDEHLIKLNSGDDSLPEPSEFIKNWFRDLVNLREIPFNYLVPEIEMLPVESVRLFQIDPYWLDSLFDGAFSLCRLSNDNLESDKNILWNKVFPFEKGKKNYPVCGLILRSVAVAGWPDLVIEGIQKQSVVQPSYKTLLSNEVLLCFFSGQIEDFYIHSKPEILHFECDKLDDAGAPSKYYKSINKNLACLDFQLFANKKSTDLATELIASIEGIKLSIKKGVVTL
ncbi:MAG: hypothetical protein ACO1G9_04345 [Bacteroidota bacterium]